MEPKMEITWHDVRDWGVEGKGWTDTRRYYDRLPARARKLVSDVVWNLSRSATGFCTDFETNATELHARWVLRDSRLGEANLSQVAFSGLDLYARAGGTWRWAGVGKLFTTRKAQTSLVTGLAPVRRRYRLYLPLRNPLVRLEVGVPREAAFHSIPPRRTGAIVYYGTSITHGAFASRPGMTAPALLGRWLDRPVVNLGFSGNAKMEPAMAALLSELDPAAFVVDALPNMDPVLIRERAVEFLRILCTARPRTPVLLVNCPSVREWIVPAWHKEQRAKDREILRAYRAGRASGFDNLKYRYVPDLLGEDGEGTLDGVHPSDLGLVRLARQLLTQLRESLGEKGVSCKEACVFMD